jgi:NADH:ubiquinone oxidoreductase subunit
MHCGDPSGGKNTILVGEDALGNKYYEDNTRPYGRHRWVVYKDIGQYNAAHVHPYWHAWYGNVSRRCV